VLPDFPEIKRRLFDIVTVMFHRRVQEDGLIGSIKRVRYYEGDRFEGTDSEGHLHVSEPSLVSSSFAVERKELVSRGIGAFLDAMLTAALDQQRQLANKFHERFDQFTERTGNRIDASGRNFGPDLMLEALETMPLEFDDAGNPDLAGIRIVVHPEVGAYIRAHLTEWENDAVFQQRHAELISRKRQEWNDRESNRKLVD